MSCNEELNTLSGSVVDKVTGFMKADGGAGKTNLDLFPVEFIEKVGQVLDFGAKKYSPDNWRKAVTPEAKTRIRSAFLRHWVEYRKDQNSKDAETGLPHLWHAACCIVFLTVLERDK